MPQASLDLAPSLTTTRTIVNHRLIRPYAQQIFASIVVGLSAVTLNALAADHAFTTATRKLTLLRSAPVPAGQLPSPH